MCPVTRLYNIVAVGDCQLTLILNCFNAALELRTRVPSQRPCATAMLLQLEETGPNTAMVERSLSRGAIRIQNPDHDLGLGVRDPSHLLPLVSAHGYCITMQAPSRCAVTAPGSAAGTGAQ